MLPGVRRYSWQRRSRYVGAGRTDHWFRRHGCGGRDRAPHLAPPALLRLVYLLSLFFPLPIFVFTSPYAAVGGMTIAHGLQYLLLVGLVAAAAGPAPARLVRLTLLLNIALAGGAVLSAASHLHGANLHGAAALGCLGYGAYLGAVMAHFVVDTGLWRLRDPFPRHFVGSRLPICCLRALHRHRSGLHRARLPMHR